MLATDPDKGKVSTAREVQTIERGRVKAAAVRRTIGSTSVFTVPTMGILSPPAITRVAVQRPEIERQQELGKEVVFRADAGPDRATADTDGIDRSWSGWQRNCLQRVEGLRTGAAKVGRQQGILGSAKYKTHIDSGALQMEII